MVRVFKFGGASVKDAQGVINLAEILKKTSDKLVVVISAMGKTTNALETILAKYLSHDSSLSKDFFRLKDYHMQIVKQLFSQQFAEEVARVEQMFDDFEDYLKGEPKGNYNYNYDQLVSFGELISTKIVSTYLNSVGISNEWVDVRQVLQTDSNFREGNVNFDVSQSLCEQIFTFSDNRVYITQGFLGGTAEGETTTLGREGSDYSAALLAYMLNAQSVTIWKDVDGVLNADPRIFGDTIKLDKVSFKEAIELAYCGAQIIHPKTIKPLQNKQIALYVKSFVNPNSSGTIVYQTDERIGYPPIRIVKPRQVLVSLTPRDFSFVIEDCLSRIFAILYTHRVKANLVQSSAISFSICVDDEEHFLPNALSELNNSFEVKYNKGVELLTVRHYTPQVVEGVIADRKVYLEQKTRSTVRVVYQQE